MRALIDLFYTTLKLLARPAVLLQLAAMVVILTLAAVLTRPVKNALINFASRISLNQFEAGLPRWQRIVLRLTRSLFYFIGQLLYPLLAILLTWLAIALFNSLGWISGLLNDFQLLLWLYLAYRLVMGLLYAIFDFERVHYYQTRLFGPIFAILAISLLISQVTDPSNIASATLFSFLDSSITIGGLLLIVIGLPLWIIFTDLIKDVLQIIWLGLNRNAQQGAIEAWLTLLRYGLIGMGFVAILVNLGLDTTTIAAITGGLSIGVGFALQDVIKNFLGGLILLFEGSLRPGDWVQVGDVQGIVTDLNIRATTVETPEQVELIVPNQDWLNSTVVNHTRTEAQIRLSIPVGVSYGSDMALVQQILLEVAAEHPQVAANPKPVAPLLDFADSSVDFELWAWIADARDQIQIGNDLRLAIWNALKAHDIRIPFPQRDLHLRSVADGILTQRTSLESNPGSQQE